MKILLVIAHPNTNKSFNHAIAFTAKNLLTDLGHEVLWCDLYAEGFDPVLPLGEEKLPESELPLDIQRKMEQLRSAEGVIIVHPNWWGGCPAILHGWLDRVMRVGVGYRFTPEGPVPLLTNKTVQIISTSNTPREIELKVYGDPLENFWKTVVFGLCGSQSFERNNFESIVMSTEEQRNEWLNEVEQTIRRRFGNTSAQ